MIRENTDIIMINLDHLPSLFECCLASTGTTGLSLKDTTLRISLLDNFTLGGISGGESKFPECYQS